MFKSKIRDLITNRVLTPVSVVKGYKSPFRHRQVNLSLVSLILLLCHMLMHSFHAHGKCMWYHFFEVLVLGHSIFLFIVCFIAVFFDNLAKLKLVSSCQSKLTVCVNVTLKNRWIAEIVFLWKHIIWHTLYLHATLFIVNQYYTLKIISVITRTWFKCYRDQILMQHFLSELV